MYSFFMCAFLHCRTCLFNHIRTAHNLFWPKSNFKTHFKLQMSYLLTLNIVLFYHIRTAHSSFWPSDDWKTHFKLQMSYLLTLNIVLGLFYHIRNAHSSFWPADDSKTHFKWQKPTGFDWKRCVNHFSSNFSKWPFLALQAITSLWRYAHFRNACHIKARWLHCCWYQ